MDGSGRLILQEPCPVVFDLGRQYLPVWRNSGQVPTDAARRLTLSAERVDTLALAAERSVDGYLGKKDRRMMSNVTAVSFRIG